MTLADTETVVGLLLAGGKGRRVGGVDKGRLFWRGRPVAEVVADSIKAVAPALIISANRSLDAYRQLSPEVVCDEPAVAGAGPLAGLLAGMVRAKTLGYSAVLVCPCDTPSVSPELLQALKSAYQQRPGQPVISVCQGKAHPLHGVYPVALVAELHDWLASGERRVYGFARSVSVREMVWEGSENVFENCNQPEDFD